MAPDHFEQRGIWTSRSRTPVGSPRAAAAISLALGLFTRPVAFILSGNMAVAYFMGHASKGFFPLVNGGDAAILYCFIFLLFFVAGPGRWNLDAELTGDDRRGDYRGRGDPYGGGEGPTPPQRRED